MCEKSKVINETFLKFVLKCENCAIQSNAILQNFLQIKQLLLLQYDSGQTVYTIILYYLNILYIQSVYISRKCFDCPPMAPIIYVLTIENTPHRLVFWIRTMQFNSDAHKWWIFFRIIFYFSLYSFIVKTIG